MCKCSPLFLRTLGLSCLKLRKGGLCCRTKPGSAYPYTVKSIYWQQVVVKESAVFTPCQARSPRQLVLKTPELLAEFHKAFLFIYYFKLRYSRFTMFDNYWSKAFFLMITKRFGGVQHMACRILAPQPGIEPTPPTLEVQSEPLGHQEGPCSKALLKTRWGRGVPGCVISSCTILTDWWCGKKVVSQGLTLSILKLQWVCEVKSLLCPTLCDPMDCSLPGSSVHGIFQARIQEWVAISFSTSGSGDHQIVDVFHLVGVLASLKQRRKCASDAAI